MQKATHKDRFDIIKLLFDLLLCSLVINLNSVIFDFSIILKALQQCLTELL